MVSSAKERLSHLALENRPLERVPAIAEGPLIGGERKAVVSKGLGIGGDAAGLVARLDKVLLGLAPLLRSRVVEGEQAVELL